MAGPLYDLFFVTNQVEFESDYSLAESVQRLQDITRALSPAIRGTVAESYVSVHRADPPVRREFRPWFFGSFGVRDGRIVLRGGYSMHDGIKVLVGLWLAGCTFALWRGTMAALEGTGSATLPLVSLGMLGIGALVVWHGRNATRGDPAWISDVIAHSLKLPH
ncbi:MAG: hypothetical protein ABI588_05715 [Arenimonas sp.]